MNKWIAGLCCALFMLVMAQNASAAVGPYERLGSLFDDGPHSGDGDGNPNHQRRAAVNGATGRLYVADDVGDQIRVFDPTESGATEGAAFGAGDVTNPLGVAIDQDTGSIYVSDDDDIVRFTSAGVLDATFISPGVTGPIAFDQVHDQLVVADTAANLIHRYTATGDPVGAPFDGSDFSDFTPAFAGLQDVAVTSAGDVIVVDSDGDPTTGTTTTGDPATSRVDRYSPTGAHQAAFGPVAGAATVAVAPVNDQLLISGNQDAVNRDEVPTLTVFDNDAPNTPVQQLPVAPINMQWTTIRGLAIGGGLAARLYVVGDLDVPYGGVYGNVTIQVYQRPTSAAPEILGSSAEPTYTGADLRARINPRLEDTTYRFEYGPTDAYGASTAAKTLPAGNEPISVTAHFSDLAAGTPYHYRLVAHNAVDTTVGPDRTFTTLFRPGPDTCPNAGIRKQQGADVAGDCRAWEMVSPLDKNHGDVSGTDFVTGLVQSSPDGNSVAFFSNDGFAGASSSQPGNAYVAGRGTDGWATRAILPSVQSDSSSNNAVLSNFLSSDLSKAIVSTRARLTEDAPDARNLYLRDNTTGSYRLITKYPPASGGSPFVVRSPVAVGVSADFNHVLLRSPYGQTPDAPPGAATTIYEWVGGSPDSFRLAGRLPDGTFDPGGAAPGGTDLNDVGSANHAFSEDGSRIFFNSPVSEGAVGRLYMSENGQPGRLISATGRFWSATPTGSEALVVEPSPVDPQVSRLLRYDVDHGGATDLAPDHAPGDGTEAQITGVVAASADLSRVYFVAKGQLVPGEGVPGAKNLYLSEGGQVTFIGTLDEGFGDDSVFDSVGFQATSGFRAITPDGRKLAFVSAAQLTDYDNVTPSAACPQSSDGTPGPCREIYVYDIATRRLSCPSCAGAPSNSTLGPIGTVKAPPLNFISLVHGQHNFTEDGSRLYFQSNKALVPQDRNGATDVYEWEGGAPRLISSGSGGGDGSRFMGASPSGDDVFIATREQLAAQDTDRLNDIYDARVDGGFAGPPDPTLPCQGDACRGLPSPAVSLPVAASITFSGAGNEPDTPSSRTPRRATVSKPKAIRGSAGTVQVKVPEKGRLALAGSGLRSSSRTVTKAGSYRVKVALTKRAADALHRKHRFVTTLRVAFTPVGGKAATVRVKVTFNQPKAKVK